ncbi:CRISPR-associated endoribonuclease Cas6 [candidate division KSB3 bacterium]|uniref:CRISPR-associated endoribonuclease Cas6 n=1 Tax=candidate division KSB3 bacterium TaxID=2044937 RepID=A0A2G6KJ67_9BACT|nr:MAG: CRISPR-associated endoribonuclease Cas6 [candidate division KSB3 bacterium]
MPFSIFLQVYPHDDIPLGQAQGPALQGMFLSLIRAVDPAAAARLHEENRYRPYTLSPLGLGDRPQHFLGFCPPREPVLKAGTACHLRITLLEDELFPLFGRCFAESSEPSFQLGPTRFVLTGVLTQAQRGIEWTRCLSYADLHTHASRTSRKISLQFLTPTSFRRGKVDFLLPDPRLVFRSYRVRLEEMNGTVRFPADFDEQVEFYTGISNLKRLETAIIKTKKVKLIGFTGRITYMIDKQAPPDLVYQMNLLADYAFFCGTGRKTTVGMGQTVRRET